MKMISSILLLLILSSCLCAATFVVNVTQSSYQAEENHSITLEWTFTSEPDSCLNFKFMIFTLITENKKVSILLHEHGGVEVPQSQDKQFSGRVQSDKELLKDGRIKLHVSRLRINDSGQYLCEIQADCGFGSDACRLIVRAGDKQPESPTENKGLMALFVLPLCPVENKIMDFNQLIQRVGLDEPSTERDHMTINSTETGSFEIKDDKPQ